MNALDKAESVMAAFEDLVQCENCLEDIPRSLIKHSFKNTEPLPNDPITQQRWRDYWICKWCDCCKACRMRRRGISEMRCLTAQGRFT